METIRFDRALAVQADAGTAAASSALAREQRLCSLGRANQIRTARATLKKELASGRVQIEEVLAQPPVFATTAKVSDLLLAVPGLGPVRATRSLARCQIPYEKTVAGLSERQRSALLALLRTEKLATIEGPAVSDDQIVQGDPSHTGEMPSPTADKLKRSPTIRWRELTTEQPNNRSGGPDLWDPCS